MAKKLKLYVWSAFSPDYYDGLAFAIAETEHEARALVVEAYGTEPSNWGPVVETGIEKVSYAICGGG